MIEAAMMAEIQAKEFKRAVKLYRNANGDYALRFEADPQPSGYLLFETVEP